MALPTETDLTTTQTAALRGETDAVNDHVYPDAGDNWVERGTIHQRTELMRSRVSNHCRVVKDGTLTYGVMDGDISFRGSRINYAGSAENALTDDKTNYIYLSLATGAAVLTVSVTAFPTDGTPHVPLAEIVAADAAYAYTDITDRRCGIDALDCTLTVEENTAGVASPNVLLGSESGKVITNEGSTATNYNTLPTAVAGQEFTFVRADASDDIRITAAAGDMIVVGGTVTKAAGYIESTARWDSVHLIAIDEAYWYAIASYGTWTVETS